MSIHTVLNCRTSTPARRRPIRRRPPSSRLFLESLEDRCLLSFSPATSYPVGGSPTAPFVQSQPMQRVFDRSRITFYSAEGLKELARDQMADAAFFDSLLGHFKDGLFYTYSVTGKSGLDRLSNTVQAAQSLQVGAHILEPHATPSDREGICHHLANDGTIEWCPK